MNLYSRSSGLTAAAVALISLTAMANYTRTPDRGQTHVPSAPLNFPTTLRQDPQAREHAENRLKPVFSEDAPSLSLARPARAENATELIGNIYGVCNSFAGMNAETDYAQAFWGKMDFSSLTATPIAQGAAFMNANDNTHQTGAVRDGILYIPEGQRSTVRDFEVVWKRYDLDEGRWLPNLYCGEDLTYWCQAMTYDPVTDAFYGMSGLEDAGGNARYGRIVKITLDPETSQPVAKILQDRAANAVNLNGFAYHPGTKQILVIDDEGWICDFDRTSGNVSQICQLVAETEYDQTNLFAQFDYRGTSHFVFSPKDECLIYMVPVVGAQPQEVAVYTVDPDTGEARLNGTTENGAYLTTLWTPDEFAAPDAADMMTLAGIDLAGASLSGKATYTAPTTLYNGLALSGAVTVKASLDGVEIYSRAAQPGATVEVPFSTTEGEHLLTARADIGDKPGPELRTKFWAGNDQPLTPLNVTISGNTLRWVAPGAKGLHDGYVDVDALTYDVYFDGVKVNAQPVSGTSYTFSQPAQMKRTEITVTASANGKTSLHSEPLSAVLGDATQLPFSATPTADQAELFTVIDFNNDGARFTFNPEDREFQLDYETFQGSNDWLVLPAITFPDADRLYEFSVDFQCYTLYYGTENVSIYLGTQPTYGSLSSNQLDTYPELNGERSTKIKTSFTVDQPGTYYIGILCKTGSEGAGARLKNFLVQELSSAVGVPARANKVEMEAAPLGELTALFTVTAPTLDVKGNKLPADEKLTVKVANLNGKATETLDLLPGSTADLEVAADNGFNSFRISVASKQGEGPSEIKRGYIGVDLPNIITDLKGVTAEDNRTMTLSWSPVTATQNGGYLDPENLKYQVWYNPQGVTWNRVGQPVSETQTVFVPGEEELARYRVVVMAENSAGFIKNIRNEYVVEDMLGKPVELPLMETFALAGPAYRWNYDTRTYENASIRQVLNDELAMLGIGEPRCDDGSGRMLSCLQYGGATGAMLYMPKFRTKGTVNPVFKMKYWNYDHAASFKIYARAHHNQDAPVEVYSYTPDPETNYSWKDIRFAIPEEFQNEEWVQFRVLFDLPAFPNAYGVFDDIYVYSDLEKDVKLDAMTSTGICHVGEETKFTVDVINAGQSNAKFDIRAEVLADGRVADSQTLKINRLQSLRSQQRTFTFEARPEYARAKSLIVRLTADYEGDEMPDNNSTEMPWEVIRAIYPTVDDLTGSVGDGSASLSWTAPLVPYGAYDDMEFLKHGEYGKKMGQWTNFNNDTYETYAISQLVDVWPSAYEPRAWQAINDEKIGVHGDTRLGAHSGNQYVISFSGYDPESNAQVQVSKWMISPEVKGGTTVKFWVNTADMTMRETIHVYYSTSKEDPRDMSDPTKVFKKLCNRSKEGVASWEQTSFTLPEDATYFALVYVGWDSMAILVDDVEFEPANPDYWTIDSYDVFRRIEGEEDFSKIATVTEPSYTDTTLGGRNASYYVVTRSSMNEMKGEGPKSNVWNSDPSGIDYVEAGISGVYAVKGGIVVEGHEGDAVSVYTPDGQRTAAVRSASARELISLPAGIYLVRVADASAKLLVT